MGSAQRDAVMSEQRVLKALKSHTKTLSLDNCRLQALPAALGRLNFITTFSAKNNALKSLPSQISALIAVSDEGRKLGFDVS